GLHAGEHNLFAIDDDNVVAHVDIGRVLHVVLAGKNIGGLRREPAQRLAAGVEHEPLALDVLSTRNGSGVVHFVLLPGSAVFPLSPARYGRNGWMMRCTPMRTAIFAERVDVPGTRTEAAQRER